MTQAFDFYRCLEECRKWLSYQGPLKDFVCLNPLMSFQNYPFHEGVRRAGDSFGAYTLMDLSFYRTAYREGRIDDSSIIRAIASYAKSAEDEALIRADLFNYPEGSTSRPKPISLSGVRQYWMKTCALSLTTHATPVLLRLIGSYLDQGVAVWGMPRNREGFFATIRDLANSSLTAFAPIQTEFAKSLLNRSLEEAATSAVESLIADKRYYERYILDVVMATPGWAAMVNQVELKPHLLIERHPITLADFIGVALIVDAAVASRELGDAFQPVTMAAGTAFLLPTEKDLTNHSLHRVKMVWHDAYEWSLYRQGLQVVSATDTAIPPKPVIQAAFCIDDRECSIRRYLESCDSEIETFGTAGFFGLDFFYQYEDELEPSQNCPIVLKPRHLIKGERIHRSSQKNPGGLLSHLDRQSHSLVGGFLISQLLGAVSAFRLLRAVLRPRDEFAATSSVARESDQCFLKIHREESEVEGSSGLFEGYTYDEMAQRVAGQLLSTGLSKSLAPLVILVAHGSTTVNNTHFAAYDCGACMGKPGTPNARAFAQMANLGEVRKRLKLMNIHIPPSTVFVAALHDTTRDEFIFFDVDHLQGEHSKLLHRFQRAGEKALSLNAQERCRRFELVSCDISSEDALRHVRERSASIFEPRPELTHAGNAFAIVGRRSLTRGFYLDRRAFMNSYDPTLDPTGTVLTGILGAVIPVGGGINLTYFFSRMDNEVYGSGTKLPHNVVGLVGVSNGVEGDLLTGLPQQMVEVHEPVRLMVIVEQEPDIAISAVKANASIFQWVENEWVKYACVSPTTKTTYIFQNGKMQVFSRDGLAPIPKFQTSYDCFAHRRFYVPFAKISSRPDGERSNA